MTLIEEQTFTYYDSGMLKSVLVEDSDGSDPDENESYNLLGQGVDFYVEDIANTEVAALAERMGIDGIIVFVDDSKSLHIDTREEKWYANYSHENDEYEEVHEDDSGYCFDFLE